MKLLTKNTDYAIRALLALGGDIESYVSAKQISEEQDIPYEFLRKILQRLIKEKLVESKEGGNGGFILKASPGSIKVADVIRIFQGELQLSECMFRQRICQNRSRCVLRKNIQRIEEMVTREFRHISVQSLLKDMGKAS